MTTLNEEERKQFMLIHQKQQRHHDLFGGSTTAAPQRSVSQDNGAESQMLKCTLCKRNRPVFAGDDDIKRLP